jgi:hypothetical protein
MHQEQEDGKWKMENGTETGTGTAKGRKGKCVSVYREKAVK